MQTFSTENQILWFLISLLSKTIIYQLDTLLEREDSAIAQCLNSHIPKAWILSLVAGFFFEQSKYPCGLIFSIPLLMLIKISWKYSYKDFKDK